MNLALFDAISTIRTFAINPLVNGLILGVMVIGVFISFRVLNIADLSVEGIVPLVTMLTAVLIDRWTNPFLCLLIGMAIGAITGIGNALLTIYLKTPPLLSGIIMMALTFGFAILINSLTAGQASWVYLFYASYLSYIIVGLVILLLIWFALYFFFGTELGMSIRAAGKNEAMAKASGISVNKMSIIALAISGALIGLSASLYGQHNGMGLPTDGQGMIVIALSSLFLGETIIGRKSFKRSLLSAVIGSLLYWYIIQALMLLDTNGSLLSIFKAVLLVLIIALQMFVAYIKKRIKQGPHKGELTQSEDKENAKNDDMVPSFKESIVRHCLGERNNA